MSIKWKNFKRDFNKNEIITGFHRKKATQGFGTAV